MTARVAIRERRGKVFEVGRIVRRTVRRLTPVRPLRRSPDRKKELHPSLLSAADEVIDVVEPIRRIERIGRGRRTGPGRVLPYDDRPDERDARIASPIEHRCPVDVPPKARVVLQADEQTSRHRALRRHDRFRAGAAHYEQ